MVKTSSIQTSHAGAIFRGWVDNQSASPSGGESSGTSSTPQANNSGSDIAAGSAVVLLDDGTIEAADVAADTRPIGVALDDIDDTETGPIAWSGPVGLILTTGSVTAGNYAETTATPGEVTENATRQTGSFGYFTSTGTDPSVFLFGGAPDDGTGGGGGGTNPLLAVHQYSTSTTFSTSSTTMADVDATNMAVTFTAPASGNVLVRLTAFADIGTGGGGSQFNCWGIREATTDLTGSGGFACRDPLGGACVTQAFIISGISAGSHTYKWAYRTSNAGAAARILVNTGQTAAPAAVMEIWEAP